VVFKVLVGHVLKLGEVGMSANGGIVLVCVMKNIIRGHNVGGYGWFGRNKFNGRNRGNVRARWIDHRIVGKIGERFVVMVRKLG
jgi:hypothetical protein